MSTSSTTNYLRALVQFNRVRPVRYFAVDIALFGLPLVVAAPGGEVGQLGFVGLVSMLLVRGSALTLDDYFDADSDEIEKPERPIPSGQVTRRQALWTGVGMLVLALALGAWVGLPFLLAVVALYAILAADPLVFNKLDVPGISTVVTISSVTMLSVMGWLVYGSLGPGLAAIVVATWFWDLCHDTIGAWLDREGDRAADINSLGRSLSAPAVAAVITLGLAVSTGAVVAGFGARPLTAVVPALSAAVTLAATWAFATGRGAPETVRRLVEWHVVASYAWVGLASVGGGLL